MLDSPGSRDAAPASPPPAVSTPGTISLRTPGRQAVRSAAIFHGRAFVATLGKLAHSPINTALTVGLIGTALALPFALYLGVDALTVMTGRWDQGAEIAVFLDQAVSDRDAAALAQSIEMHPDVETVRVQGRDDVLRDFQAITGVEGLFAEFGRENPLPPVIIVDARGQVTDTRARPKLQALVHELERRQGVALVELDTQWLGRVQAVLHVLHRAVVVLSALLGASLLLVIGNVVGTMVEQQRDEIALARTCGGTDSFVRRPFTYAGATLGAAGGWVAWLVLALSAGALAGPVEALLALYPGSLGLTGIGGPSALALLGIGGAIGWIAAWAAATRALRRDEI